MTSLRTFSKALGTNASKRDLSKTAPLPSSPVGARFGFLCRTAVADPRATAPAGSCSFSLCACSCCGAGNCARSGPGIVEAWLSISSTAVCAAGAFATAGVATGLGTAAGDAAFDGAAVDVEAVAAVTLETGSVSAAALLLVLGARFFATAVVGAVGVAGAPRCASGTGGDIGAPTSGGHGDIGIGDIEASTTTAAAAFAPRLVRALGGGTSPGARSRFRPMVRSTRLVATRKSRTTSGERWPSNAGQGTQNHTQRCTTQQLSRANISHRHLDGTPGSQQKNSRLARPGNLTAPAAKTGKTRRAEKKACRKHG